MFSVCFHAVRSLPHAGAGLLVRWRTMPFAQGAFTTLSFAHFKDGIGFGSENRQ